MLRSIIYLAMLAVVLAKPRYNPIEEQLVALIETVSYILTPIDPVKIPDTNIDIDEEDLSLYVLLQNVELKGFSKLDVKDVKATESTMQLELRFKNVEVVIPLYKVDALAIFIPLFGEGLITVNLAEFVLILHSDITLQDGDIAGVKDLVLDFALEQSNTEITGLLHNKDLSELVSAAVTDCLPEFINTYGHRLGESIAPIVELLLNMVLAPSPYIEQPYLEMSGALNGGHHLQKLISKYLS